MRIGIDVDEVITETIDAVKNYIKLYDTTGEVSSHMQEFMHGDLSNPNIRKFFENYSKLFFTEAKLKKDADRVINKLFNEKNEIYIITARGENTFKGSEKITEDYLKKHSILFTKIFWDASDKAKICKENKIDVLIDDSVKHCINLAENGLNAILFTTEVNKFIETNVPRVNNWLELEQKLKEITNLN